MEEARSVGIDGEGSDLEGDLDCEMKDGEDEVGDRKSRKGDPFPLQMTWFNNKDKRSCQGRTTSFSWFTRIFVALVRLC